MKRLAPCHLFKVPCPVVIGSWFLLLHIFVISCYIPRVFPSYGVLPTSLPSRYVCLLGIDFAMKVCIAQLQDILEGADQIVRMAFVSMNLNYNTHM